MTTHSASNAAELSRRDFVVSTAAAAGGPALGWAAPFDAQAESAGSELHVWVVVQPDDRCVIRIARSEMGQGTLTGLAQLVVEELECDWNKVGYEFPTPGQSLAGKGAGGGCGAGGDWEQVGLEFPAPGPEPRAQAGVGRVRHRRQPRHPHLRGLRPPRRGR